MNTTILKYSCNGFLLSLILITFFNSPMSFGDEPNRELETRLNKIYENNYKQPVLDSDWFKIVQAIEVQSYSVKPGDTLWGISKIYFGDGHYWSKLWSINQNITNPHLILVGDVIHFKTGTFLTAPSILVDKGDGADVEAPPAGDESSFGEEVVLETPKPGDMAPAAPLPDFFSHSRVPELTKRSELVLESRPPIVYKNDFQLTQDVFTEAPNVLGKVKSVGEFRVITGEANTVVLESVGGLSEGTTLSLIHPDIEEDQDGFIVRIMGIVQVGRLIQDNLYEAKIIRQFDSITEDSHAIQYSPVVANLDFRGTASEMPVTIVGKGNRNIWSTGDVIFLKGDGSTPSVGDLLNFKNKFSPRIDLYQQTALVKIITSHPPFATGVVVYSTTALQKNSVSRPIPTDSWFF